MDQQMIVKKLSIAIFVVIALTYGSIRTVSASDGAAAASWTESSYVRPSSVNKITCKVPTWNYRSHNYPTTVYLYESSSSISWRGSLRSYSFIPVYKSISRTSGYANGASSITITGNGFDTGRTDYRCRF